MLSKHEADELVSSLQKMATEAVNKTPHRLERSGFVMSAIFGPCVKRIGGSPIMSSSVREELLHGRNGVYFNLTYGFAMAVGQAWSASGGGALPAKNDPDERGSAWVSINSVRIPDYFDTRSVWGWPSIFEPGPWWSVVEDLVMLAPSAISEAEAALENSIRRRKERDDANAAKRADWWLDRWGRK